jgi:hypothetical protein
VTIPLYLIIAVILHKGYNLHSTILFSFVLLSLWSQDNPQMTVWFMHIHCWVTKAAAAAAAARA